MGDFYEKSHFTIENFKFGEVGVKFRPKYQKVQSYAKTGRINRLV